MKYLLDSNAWIGWLRQNRPNLKRRIQQENPADVILCSVVLGELIYGAERSGPSHKAMNHMRLVQLRRQLPSLPFDDHAAEKYGEMRAFLESMGTPIGPNDLMIAAIALARRLTLVTHNTKEFSRVPGLALEDWQ